MKDDSRRNTASGGSNHEPASPRPTSSRAAFPPAHRLRKRSEFLLLQTKGRKVYSPHFLLFYQQSPLPYSRLGITVSKKVDLRSARRNRVKRMLREIFRRNTAQLARPADLLLIARSGAAELSFDEVRDEVLALYRRARLTEPERTKETR